MKFRNSLVSNSSSSSFIIQSKDINIDSYLGVAILDNCFGAHLYEMKDASKWPKEIKKDELWTIKIPEIEQEEDDTYTINFDDCSIDVIYDVLKLIKKNCKAISLWTGGTSSRVEPQVLLQSVLIDLGIDYEVQGDGSFDLRKPEDVQEILSYNDGYKGAIALVLDKYKG